MRPSGLQTARPPVRLLRAAVIGWLGLAAAPAAAQIPDTAEAPVDSVIITPEVPVTPVPATADTAVEPISPAGAFVRSLAVPGWGQSEFGSYFRGGVYFAGWAANWFMLFRTYSRLGEARSRFDRRRDDVVYDAVADSLIAHPDDAEDILDLLDDPAFAEAVVRQDPQANDLRKLVRAREQQREDWVAWSIFWVLAAGLDGFVTAHLSDFPAGVDLEPEANGAVTLRVDVPVGRVAP